MFVKQVVEVAVDTLGCSIEHDSAQLYSGNIKLMEVKNESNIS